VHPGHDGLARLWAMDGTALPFISLWAYRNLILVRGSNIHSVFRRSPDVTDIKL